jgi:hypothetical protein
MAVCAGLVFAASPAFAQAPSKAACVEAYKTAQESSRSGALTRARESALLCARDPCPAVLQKDCKEWVADVEQRMPTILVVLKDGDGNDMSGGRVTIDGAMVASRIDGRALEIDPGEHQITITIEGRPPLVQTIVAREREKGREVAFALEPTKPREAPPPPPPPPPTEPTPPKDRAAERRPLGWPFYTAAGASAAGFVVFGIFGLSGLGIRGDLDSCKPNCSQDRIDHGKTSFLVADVALGVGLVAAGVATFLYITRP